MFNSAPNFWYDRSTRPHLVKRALLSSVSSVYKHKTLSRIAKSPAYKSTLPVICVGNITVGGTGKTPVVRTIRSLLKAHGRNASVLLRGYGGRQKGPVVVDRESHNAKDVGDEALLHGLDGDTIVSADRADGAKLIEKIGRTNTIIMDDGFQNRSLHQDIKIVVVDGARGFGNEEIIPRGPLREPIIHGLKRADALIVTGEDKYHLVKKYSYLLPTFHSKTIAVENSDIDTSARYLAFAGIGAPQKFITTLKEANVDVDKLISFPDHHPYSDNEMEDLVARAELQGLKLITTEKDWVRIPAEYKSRVTIFPITCRIESDSGDENGFQTWLLSQPSLRG